MLDRKSQSLDLQRLRVSQETINVDGKGMGSQLGQQTGAQAPESMRMIEFNLKLLDQLPIHRFNDLTHSVVQATNLRRELGFLVGTRDGMQVNSVVLKQSGGQGGANEGFIAEDRQIGMGDEHFFANRQIAHAGRGEDKINNDPLQGDQPMQFVTKDGHFLAGHFPKIRPMHLPIPGCARHQMKLNHRNRQTINRTVVIVRQIQHPDNGTADQIESIHQIPPPPIETTLRRKVREQIPMFVPVTQHFCLQHPSSAFPDQRHRQQLTIAAFRSRSRTFEQRGDFSPHVIDNHLHPQAEIVKILYHQLVSPCGFGHFDNLTLPHPETFRLTELI